MSKIHSSTFVALAEKSAKFTPIPSQVAPSGKGWRSRTRLRIAGPDRMREGGTDVTWMFMQDRGWNGRIGNAAKPQKLRRRLLPQVGHLGYCHGCMSNVRTIEE